MRRAILTLASVLALGLPALVSAQAGDVVVIANKGNTNAIDKALLTRLYTGDAKSFPDGSAAVLFDQPEDSPVRADFSSKILGKSVANLKAAWAQLIFTGKGVPPKIVDGDGEVKKAVAANKNAIGYVKAGSVDDSVKVILK